MRYLIITFYKKPDGKIDEAMSVAKKVKSWDNATANVILDFKDQKVVRCIIDGAKLDTTWDQIVAYYYPIYTNIIERLFTENGHELPEIEAEAQPESSEPVAQ